MNPVNRSSSRPIILLLAALTLTACGTTPSGEPDAGGNAPDAAGGGETPDAGEVGTPDAGDDTPDAGGGGTGYQVRVFNLMPNAASGGVFATLQIYFNVESMHLSDYVDIPATATSLQFGPTELSSVDLTVFEPGDKVLIGVASIQGQIVARAVEETANAETPDKKQLTLVTTFDRFGFRAGEVSSDIAAGGNAVVRFGNDVEAGFAGRIAADAAFRIHLARIPAGGNAILVAHEDDYYLLGATGRQEALWQDLKVNALNLSFGLGDDAVFKAATPVGELTFASDVDFQGNVSAARFLPMPITSITVGQGTQGGSATLPFTSAEAQLLYPEADTTTILASGNTVRLQNLGGLANPANGGNNLLIYGLEANIRFRASVLNANGSVVGWYPDFGAGYVEPLGAISLFFGSAGPAFRVGFGISNPPSAPQGLPEPTFSLTGMTGAHTSFFYTAGGGWKLGLVRSDGTLTVFSADPQ